MRLLIAEDDAFFSTMLQNLLRPYHELIITRDGNEAWAQLQDPDAPRMAILDWVMPGLSGPQLCRNIRASSRLSMKYLIILTAKNSEAEIVSGLRSGADDYITKPPVPAELLARVKMGERVLALQDSVQAQSLLVNQASEREKNIREFLSNCPRCGDFSNEQDTCEGKSCLRQHLSSRGGSRATVQKVAKPAIP